MRTSRSLRWLSGLLVTAACAGPASTREPDGGRGPDSSSRLEELPDIDLQRLRRDIEVLASDEFEGRAPGTKGEALTVDYLIAQFEAAGLRPGQLDGTYVQHVPLVGITAAGGPLVLDKGAAQRRLTWGTDIVAWSKRLTERAVIDRSELVFVGYGIVAPEFGWDDYKGFDVAGKTLVMLVNDPPVPSSSNAGALDPEVFGGQAMTYYGRWTYKFEIGAEKGAAAVLIVHETGPAGYPFSVVQGSNLGEKFDLVTPDRNSGRVAIEGWVPVEAARLLFEMAGRDFEALKAEARTRAFRPVPLGVTASMALTNTLRTVDSRNVLARLDGSDAALEDEAVIYTAHWDHLGVGAPVEGDRIYNGAKDNASGTAGLLEIARLAARLPPPPRSLWFLAVTAEEQGLLGSQHYASAPAVPLVKTVANINLDSLNVHGRTADVTVIGHGASELDDYVEAAAREQGRTVRPDPEPQNGYYYRSDHFNFARHGVPALFIRDGIEFIGRPAAFGDRVRRMYTERQYHKPSDEVTADWDLTGAADDLRLLLAVGYRVAQAQRFPQWRPGHEFRAKREAMLKVAKN
jgi:Zn-dependent M28 family amino/carboxypeptidase